MSSENLVDSERTMSGKVCLVTGATRGIGKGIAVALGGAGATVYITGRTLEGGSEENPGSLKETASEVESRGGTCHMVRCDHGKDDQIRAVFEKISREQDGRLDVLVNNAYAGVRSIMENVGRPFWETGIDQWDQINLVGLRNTYLCSVLAADMMVKKKDSRRRGLIVNISSVGGLSYLFNVPYGIGKCAVDRMAADCAQELRRHNIAYVSLWPGMVKTENMTSFIRADEFKEQRIKFGRGRDQSYLDSMLSSAESVEFSGCCIEKLATDPNVMSKTGKILMTSDLAQEYDITDPVTGRKPSNMREVSNLLSAGGWMRLARVVPSWVKVPRWLMHLGGNKF